MSKKLYYHDYINKLYPSKYEPQIESYIRPTIREITFQITENCNFACSYCYQICKTPKVMSFETAKKGIDLLFNLYEEDSGDFINKNTKAIILNFIGGEPLLEIKLINNICEYFMRKCIELNHPWMYTWRISMISNGSLYFTPEVQSFLKKFKNFISFDITIDGPEYIHDSCRKYSDGSGTFKDAYAAFIHYNKNYNIMGTKITIAPENLQNINKIVDFFINEGITNITANPIAEVQWTSYQANIYYNELKMMANKLLNNPDIECTLFNSEFLGHPLGYEHNTNWCGGTVNMLAFDPEGNAYPCIRYMPSSLGDEVEPIIIGTVEGLQLNQKQKNNVQCLECLTRRSQSTDECFYCPIAAGCGWCSGWNYQQFKTLNKRSTNLCEMHKARVLANIYYWNLYYKKYDINKKFKMHIPREWALNIIDENEYNMLLKLSKEDF